MEIGKLIDTNVFLEILLKQDHSDTRKRYLEEHFNSLYISDFSFHSIGVILFRMKKHDVFNLFIQDVSPKITVLTLPDNQFAEMVHVCSLYNLDFDDCYQMLLAQSHDLELVTLDKDFLRVKNEIRVDFLNREQDF